MLPAPTIAHGCPMSPMKRCVLTLLLSLVAASAWPEASSAPQHAERLRATPLQHVTVDQVEIVRSWRCACPRCSWSGLVHIRGDGLPFDLVRLSPSHQGMVIGLRRSLNHLKTPRPVWPHGSARCPRKEAQRVCPWASLTSAAGFDHRRRLIDDRVHRVNADGQRRGCAPSACRWHVSEAMPRQTWRS